VFPILQRPTPLLDALRGRPIFQQPLFRRLNSQGLYAELPPGVSLEEAVEITASLPWARGWAEGVAKMAGYVPGTKEYEEQVKRLSKFVAARLVGG